MNKTLRHAPIRAGCFTPYNIGFFVCTGIPVSQRFTSILG
jgi:hypothetical protein